ncbi:hypothetical protein [Glycomyces xiaoerkulensis]|uniref:hypothetical protein n=1 Tax=Glycomyces xiaoerkulensis TaxID=2038139 RepID=UPI000C25DF0E|nr:hypothetical protein [Glycomyces xiaoerkulensis]
MAGLDPDDAAFAARVARLDPDALVRVREGRLWASLPIGALAARESAGELPDAVYRAGDLSEGRIEPRPDADWRGRLPAGRWETIEAVPAADITAMDRQAAEALRQRRGQGIGDRRLRDVLLDHVALRVQHEGREYPVEFRLVVAVMRMRFVGDDPVRVLRAGRRVGLAATYGAVWERERGLPLL